MDGTHDCIPSRIAGQQFSARFLPDDPGLASIPVLADKAFLINGLALPCGRTNVVKTAHRMPQKQQDSVGYTNRYRDACFHDRAGPRLQRKSGPLGPEGILQVQRNQRSSRWPAWLADTPGGIRRDHSEEALDSTSF
jgi:hypothetical protein